MHLSIFDFRHNIFTNWGYYLVDCKVGDWKPWGECSLTCGGGTKTRARDVIVEPKNGGALCPGLEETMDCNTEQCPGTLFPSGFFSHQNIFLNVDHQLTARLTNGQLGANVVRLARVEPRGEQGRSSKNQWMEELRVRLWRRGIPATI